MNGKFVLNPTRGKVMGIAAGLSDWLGVDVLIVRLALIATVLITGPVAILFYLVTGWLADSNR